MDTSAISESGIGRCQTMTAQALVASIRSGKRELPASARHARFSLPLRTRFKPDDLVFHPRFGRGRIIEEWGSWLDVDPNGGRIASVLAIALRVEQGMRKSRAEQVGQDDEGMEDETELERLN